MAVACEGTRGPAGYASAFAFHPSRLMVTAGKRASRIERESLAPVDGRGAMGCVAPGSGPFAAFQSRLACAAGVRPEAAIAGHPEGELGRLKP